LHHFAPLIADFDECPPRSRFSVALGKLFAAEDPDAAPSLFRQGTTSVVPQARPDQSGFSR
jgi:hypothetical protein